MKNPLMPCLKDQSTAALIWLIVWDAVSCIFGMQLWLLIVTIALIFFSIYTLISPSSMVFRIQAVISVFRVCEGCIYGIWLLVYLSYKGITVPSGYIFEISNGYAYLVTAIVLLFVGILINLYCLQIFMRYSRQLQIEEEQTRRLPVAYAMQIMRSNTM